jgi:hypothetical protein
MRVTSLRSKRRFRWKDGLADWNDGHAPRTEVPGYQLNQIPRGQAMA